MTELIEWTDDTVKIVPMLGGHRGKYQRERGRAVRKMVAQIYSAPRVTETFKLLPSMELVKGLRIRFVGRGRER